MPLVEIKTALQTILEAAFGTAGDQRIKHVLTQYPREGVTVQPGDFPRIVLWGNGHDPLAVMAGGRTSITVPGPSYATGMAMRSWDLIVHVWTQITAPEDEGDTWHALVDAVESMLMQYGTLDGAHGTTAAILAQDLTVKARAVEWEVEWCSVTHRQDLPPVVNETMVDYHSLIGLTVRERIKI